ncbi:MAG: hypothetical protein RDV41_02815 [Planctomycetota bacterium]|nr:hypothetical protein [Planctomycetota bacterium]
MALRHAANTEEPPDALFFAIVFALFHTVVVSAVAYLLISPAIERTGSILPVAFIATFAFVPMFAGSLLCHRAVIRRTLPSWSTFVLLPILVGALELVVAVFWYAAAFLANAPAAHETAVASMARERDEGGAWMVVLFALGFGVSVFLNLVSSFVAASAIHERMKEWQSSAMARDTTSD